MSRSGAGEGAKSAESIEGVEGIEGIEGVEGAEGIKDADAVEHDVASYLRETPEFFVRHRELAARLEIPHGRNGTVSLVEYQVRALRREIAELHARVEALVENARRNEDRAQRVHHLALRLLEARGLDEMLAGFYESMGEEFGVDRVVVRLLRPPALGEHAGLGEFISGDETLDAIARSRIPVCGGLDEARCRALFGESAAEIASAAAVGLEDAIGVLALGSRDPKRFGAQMGTLFLRQLAVLISRALRCHVVR